METFCLVIGATLQVGESWFQKRRRRQRPVVSISNWKGYLFRKRFADWIYWEGESIRVAAVLGIDENVASRVVFVEGLAELMVEDREVFSRVVADPAKVETGGYRAHMFWSSVFG